MSIMRQNEKKTEYLTELQAEKIFSRFKKLSEKNLSAAVVFLHEQAKDNKNIIIINKNICCKPYNEKILKFNYLGYNFTAKIKYKKTYKKPKTKYYGDCPYFVENEHFGHCENIYYLGCELFRTNLKCCCSKRIQTFINVNRNRKKNGLDFNKNYVQYKYN